MTQNNDNLHEVEDPNSEYYEPKPEGEKDFWKRHLVNKHKDRNGNGSDHFSATNIAKDKSRLKGDPKADLDNSDIGNRPSDELKGEKGISNKKIKEHSIVSTIRAKAAVFKERYGDGWKDAMGYSEIVSEDSQSATSDNPGGVQGTTGTVDNNNSHLNNNPTSDPPGKGDVKNTLEAIAMQAAELHDKLEDGQDIDSQAQAMLGEAKEALDQVYEMVTNNSGAQDAKPTSVPKNNGASANVKEETDDLDEAPVYLNRKAWRGATPKLKVSYGKDPYTPEEREAARKKIEAMSKQEEFEDLDNAEELFEEIEALEEATVKDKTGTIVGTHRAGEGFKPNALGKKLGHKAHPTDVPSDTTITKRGRKVGSKSFGASKRKGESSDEAGAHSEKPSFTDQLLKAADSRAGGHVEFDNGQKHHIPRVHANAGLYHLGKPEKPADKNKVRKHIGASKENFDSFRKSGGQLPKEAPAYDPDARIKARTSQITTGTKKPRSAATVALAQKILARRKAGK